MEQVLKLLLKYAKLEGFKGYDPYDALNSPILKFLGFNKYLRILFTQTIKHLPFNLRKLLLIKKDYNPKGIGLFLSVFSKLQDIENYYILRNLLLNLSSKGYSGYCWGYNFPWQSRVFYLKPYSPTIVNTSFIGHAFLDAYESFENTNDLKVATSCIDFILNDLNIYQEDDFLVFSYTPIDKLMVFNASLLGGSLISRVYLINRDEKLRDIALKCGMFAYKFQNKDGSWFYAPNIKYIDNFHSAYNLLSLKWIYKATEDKRINEAIEKGYEFYKKHLFTENYLPKYYHNKLYPLDIHSYATAIVLFVEFGEKEIAKKILDNAIDRMFDIKKQYFYFQEYKFFKNKIPYMRWSIAWMSYAISKYLNFKL
ncbi:MAG: delta-aminolevulinic acid dehydratase [candidate division WOR-3 bacterium]|nr:delta-aminolevulinic acid dehydratase [candidate division WOR-3 bacterium]MDW8150665.1 delta-aminolevulinic acid dehydratase [candidate division WOR-3 bacterium]